MTSKHLFFKAMMEDLRHKLWMIALSALGNFLLLPVAWLVNRSNMMRRVINSSELDGGKYYWTNIMDFLADYIPAAGGFIAIAGALIVGLVGFRYVFHKRMIDTYHSIPIKRGTLYSVCWLNGFLIWLVPFLISFLATFAMVFSFAGSWFNEDQTPLMLIREAVISFVVLVVVFLLIYHLVLTAVMVSGNVLNTLVSMAILGIGVASIYSMIIGFFSFYMTTFFEGKVLMEPALYLSPFLAAIYLLYQRVDYGLQSAPADIWLPVIINACVAVVLGFAAWLLYKRRASELAEQGIRNKVLTAVLRILVSVGAGMGGWMIFILITSSESAVGWGIFGALLAVILTFGIMDIIFNMDFKAFFSHKLQMAGSVVLCLLICFSLYGDWYGYDTYLPDKEHIAEISITDNNYTNRSLYYTSLGREAILMDITSIQDVDAAYSYLEEMTAREKRGYIFTDDGEPHYSKQLKTKVTLKNGKTYYRVYHVTDMDFDLVSPLYTNIGYLERNYLLDEQWMSGFDQLAFHREDQTNQTLEIKPEAAVALARAYNKDILENPASVLFRQGVLLARFELEGQSGYSVSFTDDDTLQIYRFILEVYDTMSNTIEVMEQMGYGDWTAKKSADDIAGIQLYVYGKLDDYDTAEDVIEDVRVRYGVPAQSDGQDEDGSVYYLDILDGKSMALSESVEQEAYFEGQLFLNITDRAEIEELTALLNYEEPYRSDNIFVKGSCSVYVEDNEGMQYRYYIRAGELPEKYVLRFGQLYEYLKQQ